MPVGILVGMIDTTVSIVVPDGAAGFDLHAALGSPSVPLLYNLTIPSGNEVGAPDQATPAIDASGLHADSIGYWINEGRVAGAGGAGGDALPASGTSGAGGGGGGAGDVVGTGGTGDPNGSNGADGTATAGGSGGGSVLNIIGAFSSDNAADGGAAVWLNHQIYIDNGSGEIWGGGGGGVGGWADAILGVISGGDGGTPGNPGLKPSGLVPYTPGSGGHAIKLIGGASAPVFSSGDSSPNVEGTVGA